MYTRTPVRKMLPYTANPYGNCSASTEDYKDILTCLMKAMDELDNPKHMPDGLDPSIWEQFCQARRSKMESEQLVCKSLAFPLYFSVFSGLKTSVEFNVGLDWW